MLLRLGEDAATIERDHIILRPEMPIKLEKHLHREGGAQYTAHWLRKIVYSKAQGPGNWGVHLFHEYRASVLAELMIGASILSDPTTTLI